MRRCRVVTRGGRAPSTRTRACAPGHRLQPAAPTAPVMAHALHFVALRVWRTGSRPPQRRHHSALPSAKAPHLQSCVSNPVLGRDRGPGRSASRNPASSSGAPSEQAVADAAGPGRGVSHHAMTAGGPQPKRPKIRPPPQRSTFGRHRSAGARALFTFPASRLPPQEHSYATLCRRSIETCAPSRHEVRCVVFRRRRGGLRFGPDLGSPFWF